MVAKKMKRVKEWYDGINLDRPCKVCGFIAGKHSGKAECPSGEKRKDGSTVFIKDSHYEKVEQWKASKKRD